MRKKEDRTKKELRQEIAEDDEEIGGLKSDLREAHQDLQDSESNLDDSREVMREKIRNLENMRKAMLNMLEDLDVSKKKLLVREKDLENAVEELEEMDKKKDQFISIASHELRTPIASIRGFVQLLKESVEDVPDEAREYLDIIEKDTRRLDNLIGDVLDLSRIDLDTLELDYSPEKISSMVQEIVDDFAPQLKQGELRTDVDVDKRLSKISVDRERFSQILRNLLSNAIKFSPEGSIIKVKAEPKGNNVVFSVSDAGPGIPKKYQQKIFDRFFQVDSSLRREKGGTGLGLAVCKELVSLMGGKIWVESTQGKGSTFYFTLPGKGALDRR